MCYMYDYPTNIYPFAIPLVIKYISCVNKANKIIICIGLNRLKDYNFYLFFVMCTQNFSKNLKSNFLFYFLIEF